jgi:hypothetical protein
MAKIQLDVSVGGDAAVNKLKQEVADLRTELDRLKGTTDSNKKSESGLAAYRKEQIKEMRNYRFVVNEVKDAIGAGTIALNLMSLGADNGNQKMKSLTNTVNTAFIAFQGADAITSVFGKQLDSLGSKMGLAGGQLGLIISLGASVAGIIASIAGESAAADKRVAGLNDKLFELNYQLGLVSDRDYLVKLRDNISAAKQKIEELQKTFSFGTGEYTINTTTKTKGSAEEIDNAKLALAEAEKALKDFNSKSNQTSISQAATIFSLRKTNELKLVELSEVNAINKAKKIYTVEVEYLNKEYNFKLDSMKKGSREEIALTAEHNEKLIGLQRDLQIKLKEESKKSGDSNLFMQLYFGGEAADTLNSIKSTLSGFNADTKKMFGDNAPKSDYDAQKAKEKKDLEDKLAMYDAYATGATSALQTISEFSAMANQANIDAIQIEKDARMDALDAEKEAILGKFDAQLENDNLTSAQRKRLEKEREAAEKVANEKKAKEEEKYNERIRESKRSAWISERNAKLAMATIDMAHAIVVALTGGAIAGPILAGITAATAAAQVAIIASTPVPKFHTGGIVGQQPLRSNERVIIGQVGEQIIPKNQVGSTAGGITLTVNFNAPTDTEYVTEAIKKVLTETGKTIDKVFVNQNANVAIG